MTTVARTVAAALLATGAGCVLAAPAPAAGRPVAETQPLVVLLQDHVARSGPTTSSARLETVGARRPLTGVRTVLPVLAAKRGSDGASWLHVRLPGRPSGHKGWIRADRTRRTATPWRISVKLSTRTVTAYLDGRVERRFAAVVGTPSTPTPRGESFVEETVALAPSAAGAPFALALGARSRVFQEFDGGPGQIALHGMAGLPEALGTASSHGCVRLSARAITWLARRIGAGVPVTVR